MLLGRARSAPVVSASAAADRESGSRSDSRPTRDDLRADRCPRPQVEGSSSSHAEQEAAAPAWDVVDEWGVQSFPASDPPANW